MKKIILCLLILNPLLAFTQIAQKFDGRWCFTGSSVILFSEIDNKLYFMMVEEGDSVVFSNFLNEKKSNDKSQLSPVLIDSNESKVFLFITINSVNRANTILLVHDNTIDSVLNFVGNTYYDTSKVKKTNSNCNLTVPICNSYFYRKGELKRILALKKLSTLNKGEIFEVFSRFEIVSRTKCNRCYEGFPGGDFNKILIEMGFNPINTSMFNNKTVFNISAFDYIKDTYIKNTDNILDQSLYDHYKKILNRYWGRE